MLIGAEDALYGIATRNGGKKKPVQIPGIGRVYQMSLVEELGLIIAIVGRSGLICLFSLVKSCLLDCKRYCRYPKYSKYHGCRRTWKT